MEELTGFLKNSSSQIRNTWLYWNEYRTTGEYRDRMVASDPRP